jgi:thiosulfate/3-mercaptopyruvate sulfurtransferase
LSVGHADRDQRRGRPGQRVASRPHTNDPDAATGGSPPSVEPEALPTLGHTHDVSLMSVADLARRLEDPRLRVVDTRWYLLRPGDGRLAFDAGHIQGAMFLDLDTDLSAPAGPSHIGGLGRHPLPTPSEFAARMGQAGIGDDSHVVAYDDAGGGVAARLWWMLDALGHREVAVLDGGWQGWLAAGLPTEAAAPDYPATTLTTRPSWPRTIERRDLTARLTSVVLLDGRAAERYRGDVEPIDPAAGHIPSAISAPIGGNLGLDGRFLPAIELRHRFQGLGASPARPSDARPTVVTSCGSGTNACQTAFAMRLAGLPDPLLYVGSFSDWSRAGQAVVKGCEPGRPATPAGSSPDTPSAAPPPAE